MSKMRTKPKILPDLAKVELYASKGLNDKKTALLLGMSVSTLYARKRENEEFKEAYTRGRAKNEILLSDKMDELIMSKVLIKENGKPLIEDGKPVEEYKYPPDVRLKAMMFKLERLHGWYKREERDVTSSDGSMTPKSTNIDLSAFTPEQLVEMGRAAFRGE